MVLLEKRKIIRKSIEQVDFTAVATFFSDSANRDTICLVISDHKLYTLFSFEDFCKCSSEAEFHFFLEYSNNNSLCFTADQAESTLKCFPLLTYVIQSIDKDTGKFFFAPSLAAIANRVHFQLSQCNVHVFRINIPYISDIVERNRADRVCKHGFVECLKLLQTGDANPPDYLTKITDVPIADLAPGPLLDGKKLGKADRTIFLVGPCIVGGWENPKGERLAEILFRLISDAGLDYSIACISMNIQDSSNMTEILEHDIRKDDLVFIFASGFPENELDVTELYNGYLGNKFLYTNQPIHTTVTANRLIADALLKNIILPLISSNHTKINEIAYWGKPQFPPATVRAIGEYAERIKNIRFLPPNATAGSIVMNCNPFTYGHRYLIETVARQVDFLYIFVVEEDQSAIPFVDRLFLVRQGTQDIDNVIIVPSGRFIISKDTFSNYFDKENATHTANADEDIEIFGRYVAPILGISKRFAGSEPYDDVTNSYNGIMQRILPQYGVGFEEIPRKTIDGRDTAINATAVRKALVDNDFEIIRASVPAFVADYLNKNRDTVLHRMQLLQARKANWGGAKEYINALLEKIKSLQKAVLYSIGNDTEGIIKLLDASTLEKIEYCDRIAETKDLTFHGKQVHKPADLLTELKDYSIVVGSTIYGARIYRDFIAMGIDLSRCIFNVVGFDKVKSGR